MSWVLVDVEATGISPASGVMTEFGAVEFERRLTFHGRIWEAAPDPENPAKPIATKRIVEDREVMEAFAEWLDTVCGTSERKVFVSDNPAYDFMWIADAFDRTLGYNPFGHSARRIGDFAAGLDADFRAHQKWKRYRITPHDHNPVNDAMGNAEALEKLLLMAKSTKEKT